MNLSNIPIYYIQPVLNRYCELSDTNSVIFILSRFMGKINRQSYN
jgi:hypothetical protein